MGLLGTSPTLSLRGMLWMSKIPTDSASPHSFFRNSSARFLLIAISVAMTWRRARKSKSYLKSSSPKLMGHWHWTSAGSWWRNSQIPSHRSRNGKGSKERRNSIIRLASYRRSWGMSFSSRPRDGPFSPFGSRMVGGSISSISSPSVTSKRKSCPSQSSSQPLSWQSMTNCWRKRS